MTSKTDEADFGYRTVPREAKKPMVRAVFDSVAARYDVMNDLMSLGIHRVWKRDFVQGLDPRPGRTLLDLAGGTGDIAFAWHARGGGPAILTDINDAMLDVARARATKSGVGEGIAIQPVDAEALPFEDARFDRVTIAFGLVIAELMREREGAYQLGTIHVHSDGRPSEDIVAEIVERLWEWQDTQTDAQQDAEAERAALDWQEVERACD